MPILAKGELLINARDIRYMVGVEIGSSECTVFLFQEICRMEHIKQSAVSHHLGVSTGENKSSLFSALKILKLFFLNEGGEK